MRRAHEHFLLPKRSSLDSSCNGIKESPECSSDLLSQTPYNWTLLKLNHTRLSQLVMRSYACPLPCTVALPKQTYTHAHTQTHTHSHIHTCAHTVSPHTLDTTTTSPDLTARKQGPSRPSSPDTLLPTPHTVPTATTHMHPPHILVPTPQLRTTQPSRSPGSRLSKQRAQRGAHTEHTCSMHTEAPHLQPSLISSPHRWAWSHVFRTCQHCTHAHTNTEAICLQPSLPSAPHR